MTTVLLVEDNPDELTNQAFEYPEKVGELTQEYDGWRKNIK
jgi:hypothetical protein